MDFKTLRNSKTWTTIDRKGWEDGPWKGEPDKAQWIDAATGMACLIVRNPLGTLCGYVGVEPGHPVHGIEYDDGDWDFAVHGGVTFSSGCQETTTEAEHVCHIPEPGSPDNVWWIGFDCGHGGDLSPQMHAYFKERLHMPSLLGADVYRDAAYVVAEITGLARQLAEMPRVARP